MEAKERLLAEHARPTYRHLRRKGATEQSAYEGALRRRPTPSGCTDPRWPRLEPGAAELAESYLERGYPEGEALYMATLGGDAFMDDEVPLTPAEDLAETYVRSGYSRAEAEWMAGLDHPGGYAAAVREDREAQARGGRRLQESAATLTEPARRARPGQSTAAKVDEIVAARVRDYVDAGCDLREAKRRAEDERAQITRIVEGR